MTKEDDDWKLFNEGLEALMITSEFEKICGIADIQKRL